MVKIQADNTYQMAVFDLDLIIGVSQDGASMPEIFSARIAGVQPWWGYGTTEAEAVVDLLRNRRDGKRS